jgi:hypothetical protein
LFGLLLPLSFGLVLLAFLVAHGVTPFWRSPLHFAARVTFCHLWPWPPLSIPVQQVLDAQERRISRRGLGEIIARKPLTVKVPEGLFGYYLFEQKAACLRSKLHPGTPVPLWCYLKPSLASRLLPRCRPLPAVTALAPAHDAPASVRARVDDPEVLTAAIAAFQAANRDFEIA